MPETSSSESGQRRQGRRRGNRSGGGRSDYRVESPNRPRSPRPTQQTGFQKFLSIITFGLLGKPTAKPVRPVNPARPDSSSRPGATATSPAGASAGRSDGPYVSQGPRQGRAGQSGTAGQPGAAPRERGERREPREPRPAPSAAEVTSERLYIGNLSYDATESDLVELFRGVGGVRNTEVVVNNRTQRSKGFGFVTMATIEEAKRAVTELNAKDFMGRPLQVSGAKPQPTERRGASGDAADDSPADE